MLVSIKTHYIANTKEDVIFLLRIGYIMPRPYQSNCNRLLNIKSESSDSEPSKKDKNNRLVIHLEENKAELWTEQQYEAISIYYSICFNYPEFCQVKLEFNDWDDDTYYLLSRSLLTHPNVIDCIKSEPLPKLKKL